MPKTSKSTPTSFDISALQLTATVMTNIRHAIFICFVDSFVTHAIAESTHICSLTLFFNTPARWRLGFLLRFCDNLPYDNRRGQKMKENRMRHRISSKAFCESYCNPFRSCNTNPGKHLLACSETPRGRTGRAYSPLLLDTKVSRTPAERSVTTSRPHCLSSQLWC